MFFGNRGILHDAEGRLVRRWASRAWLICVLEFRGRRVPVRAPGHYTGLFFLDEATALAAGHRPCALCRREAYNRFRLALAPEAPPAAVALDLALHQARVDARTGQQRTARTPLGQLPQGAFVALDDAPGQAFLWIDGALLRWSHGGYLDRRSLPLHRLVSTLTPEPTLRALAAGYRPSLHPSAAPASPLGDRLPT